MLSQLHIENIAVIDRADVPFSSGLNVLTGETGAGKSIIIDAIGMLLGARADRDLVRRGETRARVTGLFTELSEPVRAGLAALGIETEDGELLLERTVTAEGKASGRAGGRPVTAALLREAAPWLLNIHGQHDTGKLLTESAHLGFIDRCGTGHELLEAYRKAYGTLRGIERQLAQLETDDAEKARRSDNLRYHIGKLESAQLTAGEDEALEARRQELHAAQTNQEAAARASEALSGTEETEGAVALLRAAAKSLERGEGDEARALAEKLEALSYDAEDAAERVADMVFESDPEELDRIESRLYTIDRLRRRYGKSVAQMLEYLEQAKSELSALESADEEIARLSAERDRVLAEVMSAAEALHEQRVSSAVRLSRAIEEELAYLDMPRARFDAGLSLTPGRKPGPDGIDRAAFRIAVNAGEDPKPLAKAASGGELSRVMLALQNVLSAGDDAQTLIFDEIDTGISGRAADKVARKLRGLAGSRQILCVTHLPSLAAAGHHELFIRKTEEDGRTFTRIEPLGHEGRVREVARLMAGENRSDSVLQAARELLAAYESQEQASPEQGVPAP